MTACLGGGGRIEHHRHQFGLAVLGLHPDGHQVGGQLGGADLPDLVLFIGRQWDFFWAFHLVSQFTFQERAVQSAKLD